MADEQARWSARPHVSAEQVADLLEGLLPEAESATVAAHIDGCAECAGLRDDLEALPALLAATTASPMPIDVAARLDAALADAAADREPASRPATVTSLHSRPQSRGSRFVTRSFAGVAAAAAVVVGFVVVGNVTGGGGQDDAGGQASEGAVMSEGDDAADNADNGSLLRLDARDFRADARAAYLQSLTGADAEDGSDLARGDKAYATARIACSDGDLRGAAIPGRPGPVALLDRVPVTLVASGPRQHSLVVAYSCESGRPVEQERAYVDLTR
jgi:hypothetical protein